MMAVRQRLMPPAGFFETVMPQYRSATNGMPYQVCDGSLPVAGFFKIIVLPPPSAPASTATSQQRRQYDAAMQQRAAADSFWRHVSTYYEREKCFPPGAQYLQEHALFVVRAMAPTEGQPARRIAHISAACCPDAEYFRARGDGSFCGFCFKPADL
jgi:hypothetical protein